MLKSNILNRLVSIKYYLLFIALFIFDRLTKYFLITYFEQFKVDTIYVSNFFEIILVWNRGVSYGLFPQESYLGQIFISIFSFVICLWITKFLINSNVRFKITSLTLILAGGLSNIIDRLLYSAVADFLHFHIKSYSWYVFNVADIYIVFGLMILIYAFIWPNINFKSIEK
jgi:signal peptidase II|tara:strand:+ start:5130 stop:5642 length:513 start_codon:yes stop_codon:yes gene_type:complete